MRTKTKKNPRNSRRSQEQGVLLLEEWIGREEAVNEIDLLFRKLKLKFDRSKIKLKSPKSGDRASYILQKMRELEDLLNRK